MGKVAIIGSGTMGRGIAETCARSGYDVVMLDVSLDQVLKAQKIIEDGLDRLVQKGKIDSGEKEAILARLHPGATIEEISGCEIVIEAVFENLEAKLEVYRKVCDLIPPNTLLATNTSSLDLEKLSAGVTNPGRFIGIHFFNPVPLMKLVEIVVGDKTSQDTVEKAKEFASSLGKTYVVVKNSPGFVVNRLLCPMLNEAAYLVMEGVASPEDIDTAMKLGANHPMGPLALADLIGIDVLLSIMETLAEDLSSDKYKPCPLLSDMVRQGRLGRKSGCGFFQY